MGRMGRVLSVGLCMVLSGCPAADEPQPAASTPKTRVDTERLSGRYLVRIGGQSYLHKASSRWCYLDLQSDGRVLRATPWRPGSTLRSTQALLSYTGRFSVTIEREFSGEEVATGERWELQGLLISSFEEARAAESAPVLLGQARVSRSGPAGRTETWNLGFTAVRADQVEEEGAQFEWENPPPHPVRQIIRGNPHEAEVKRPISRPSGPSKRTAKALRSSYRR